MAELRRIAYYPKTLEYHWGRGISTSRDVLSPGRTVVLRDALVFAIAFAFGAAVSPSGDWFFWLTGGSFLHMGRFVFPRG